MSICNAKRISVSLGNINSKANFQKKKKKKKKKKKNQARRQHHGLEFRLPSRRKVDYLSGWEHHHCRYVDLDDDR